MFEIAFIVSPGFQMMALAALSVFEFANVASGGRHYGVRVLSEHGGPVTTSTGIALETRKFGRTQFDTVIVTGVLQPAASSAALLRFARKSVEGSRRTASICTGAFILAEAGVLDGRRATTHWAFARQLQECYPHVTVEDDRIFIIDGPVWTSAGMSAGVDLALGMVEKDLGADLTREVARKLVLYHRRGGGQSQHSALLEMDAKSDRIQEVLAFARQNLKAELSVEQLADVAHLSPRQFSRAFRAETGKSPAKAVEHLRIEAARLLIEQSRLPVEVIANETGFADRERMRQAFLRAFGQPPQMLRRHARGEAEQPA